VGPAGRFLDKWLAAVGLDRTSNAFIANVVKCRPPANRDPLPEETRACLPYLEAQLGLVKPKAILVLGSVAARVLLRTTRGVSALRGQWFEHGGIPLICTYHPSAVLRDEDLKRPVWDDLKKLKERLNHA
jgi:DNA polymerase